MHNNSTTTTNSATRRDFLRGALILPFVGATLLSARIGNAQTPAAATPMKPDTGTGPFQLAPLPYAFDALEPHIDAKTMETHWGKHHATYVKNLNEAASKEPKIGKKSVEYLIANLSEVPEPMRMMVRNNGGGHFNHTLFWRTMKPNGGGEPTGKLGNDIKSAFGSFAAFQMQFNEAGTKRFGSGWAWLVRGRDGKLMVMSTPNQDNPLMEGIYPVLGNDVWEHAYYLKYQNRRADYLKAWWNTVNWEFVGERYNAMRVL